MHQRVLDGFHLLKLYFLLCFMNGVYLKFNGYLMGLLFPLLESFFTLEGL